jgi:aspartyl-tRNA(Asn)/glutamyl-tRNA(Gln) amidotransferase subunit A
MTRTVGDAALMMNVIARPDARDWFALPPDATDYTAALDDGLKGLRIAYSPTLGYAKVDGEIATLVAEAARAFSALGAQVDTVERVCEDPREDFIKLWTTGCALAARSLPRDRRGEMDPGLQAFIEHGESIPHMDYAEADYARGKLGALFEALFQTYDLLLTPALPMAAFPADTQVADPSTQRHWIDWTPFTYPFNMTRQPAASMPCGFTRAGLPAGLQIVGPLNADALVMRAARAYEREHPIRLPDGVRGHAP